MHLILRKDDILKIIRKLNVSKAHGHDDISIRMLKICDSVITEPLSIIFKNCIDCGVFPDTWKMSHIMPAHKKMTSTLFIIIAQCLLPISGKILKESFLMFFYFLKIITYLLLINQVLDLRTHVSISFCQLCTVFIQILIIIHHLKLEVIFLTFLKHLIKFGMMVFYINLKVLGFLEIYWNCFIAT